MADAVVSKAEILAAIRECVAVVKPGEVLVIRVPLSADADQVQGYQEHLDAAIEWRDLKITAIVLPAEELAVAQADTDTAFAARVAKVQADSARRNRFPMGRVP